MNFIWDWGQAGILIEIVGAGIMVAFAYKSSIKNAAIERIRITSMISFSS